MILNEYNYEERMRKDIVSIVIDKHDYKVIDKDFTGISAPMYEKPIHIIDKKGMRPSLYIYPYPIYRPINFYDSVVNYL
jgi:hypothetical protein